MHSQTYLLKDNTLISKLIPYVTIYIYLYMFIYLISDRFLVYEDFF